MRADLASVPTELPIPSAMVLRLDGVGKRFDARPIFERVSFNLRRREVLALCGVSGSGKTTLIRIIAGLVGFDEGRLEIGETAVQADVRYPNELYGKIGVIFQDHNLFPHLTVLGNVTLGLREHKRLSVRQAKERALFELEHMGVASLADRYPATLSGGERQRVAIARALAMDPSLLLLDEPTANLDPERAEEVCERVLSLAESGVTMVLVTHNVLLARQAANRFALLQDGSCLLSREPAILDRLRCQRT
jgi:ABC-type polar amino acid transport system ATPase subunit